jgi:hypothetical protein
MRTKIRRERKVKAKMMTKRRKRRARSNLLRARAIRP